MEITADAEDDLLDLLTAEEDDLAESVAAINQGVKQKSVPKFCATRWSARVCTLSAMLAKYPTILKAMERIREESSGDSRCDASSYIRLLEDPQFIVALTVAQAVLSFLDPVTKALQAKDCNLAGAYKDVALAKECIRDARQDSCWDKVRNRIEQVASSIRIMMDKPRTARIQRYRTNATTTPESETPSNYYRINVYYPFIDQFTPGCP